MVLVTFLAGCGKSDTGDTGGSGGKTGGSGSGTELVEKGYQSDMDKDTIVIRGVRSITGFNGSFEETGFGPLYKMWVDKINADGGLYVKSLDRKLPVEVSVVDDQSDAAMTQQLYERVCVEDQPDWILPPVSTGALKVVVPIAQQYNYLLLGGEGGAKELEPFMADYPNFFSLLGYSNTQIPAFIKLSAELGIESVYVAYVDDTHGIEYTEFLSEECAKAGIEVLGKDALDVAGNFNAEVVINSAKASNADAFLICAYPPQNIPLTQAAATLDYNPKAYLVGPGGGFDYFGLNVFGDTTNKALDGMMFWGAWSEKSSPEAAAFSKMFQDYWIEDGSFWLNADGSYNDKGIVFQEWWGHLAYWSVMEVFQQAVENAGELDENGMLNQSTLVEYIKTSEFNTAMNPNLKFTNNKLEDDMYAGNIGQWQEGVPEVIDADDRRTADPIYPKPAWPKN
jgi:branched-chain amino acid transport system substrate-binding protein